MARIIVLDPLSKDGLALLESAGNIEVEVRTGLKGEALHDALLEFDGAHLPQRREDYQGSHGRKSAAQGHRGPAWESCNIDCEAARAGIVVMNTPGGNTISTAEQTITLMLAMSRCVARPTRA